MASKFPPTPDQAKAIDERGGNLLVAASAGSGKTSVMIERVMALLSEGAGLDGMVICTFTRAAASDMREKLTNKLIEAEEEGNAWASEGLKKLPLAEISTIHSWCQRLIRNYFYAIDADPAFEIADETEARAWLREATNEAIEETAGDDPDFADFCEVNERHRSYEKIVGDVMRLYDFAFSQPDPEKFLKEDAFKGLNNPEICDEIASEYRVSVLGRFEPLVKAILEEAEAAGFAKGIPAIDGLLAKTRGGTEKVPAMPSKGSDEFMPIVEKFARIRKAFNAEMNYIDGYEALEAPPEDKFTRIITALTLKTAEKYAAKKRKKAKLDYGDLEHLTVKLLENDEVRREIAEKYRYVFVDEYQDVNPLQERITGALEESELFLVGDVKQSIYAFRMCDPTIFRNKYEHPAENGFKPLIRLNDNFRSSRDVLDFANDVFSELMTENYGGLNYAEEAMLRAGGNVAGAGVTLTAICDNAEENSVEGVYSVMRAAKESERGSAADAETTAVGNDIIERLSKPFSDGDRTREVCLSDIAVLVESRGERVTLLVEKLRKLGVNASVSDKLRFTSVPEVCAICEFVALLADPTDDVAFCSVALSALGGLTPDDLARVRKTDRAEESFVALAKRYAGENRDETAIKLTELFGLIDRYRELGAVLTAGELVGRLVAEKKWFAVALASDGAESKAEALNAFLKHVNAYGGGGASVAEYAAYLKEESDDYSLPPTADSVRVMTIHASKGLEFPFVYLMGTGGKFNFRDLGNSMILSKELGVAIRNYDFAEHKEIPNKLTFAARLNLEKTLEEEKMRLLYVALTRPKYGLNIYATVKPNDPLLAGAVDFPYDYAGGKCFFDWLRPQYARCGFRLLNKTEMRADFSGALEKLTQKADEKVVEKMREIFDRRIEIPDTVFKKSVTAIVTDPDEQAPVFAEGADCERAIRKGNAYHKAMELIDFSAGFEDEWGRLKTVVADFDEIKKSELKAAYENVGEFVRGGKIYREQPFMFSPDGKTLVQGIIDLMVVRGDEAIIVDYKTSRPGAVASEQYRRQLGLYARAAEKVLGLKITAAYVYSFVLGKFVRHDISH